MQYDDVVSSVQARGGRPRAETEDLVHATLRVLARRLTAGRADDLRVQLPGELHGDLIPPAPEAQPSGPDEFARLVPGTGWLERFRCRPRRPVCHRRGRCPPATRRALPDAVPDGTWVTEDSRRELPAADLRHRSREGRR
ncbi:DUF2267 domain-containing protein [Modestobacter sp. NPDC049651]|uniref:DUF2267 domain-containing protein n=1 Tax=unclassified Modestobacter TaxID=2643866 RepID=UPI0033C38D31